MVAGAEVVCPSIPTRGMQCRRAARGDAGAVPAVPAQANAAADPVAVEIAAVGSELDLRMSSVSSNVPGAETATVQFVPSIRSGSFSDIGPRRDMEDEHIRVDDLASHLGSMFRCPLPSAFYGVFDGHGGPDASAYVRKHAMRLFFKDAGFPLDFQSDEGFLEEVANSVRKAFLLADAALADDCTVSSSTGTTALTALILGQRLLIANVGDCRAVLSRKGEAVEMSRDHRPIRASERRRVEECGGYVDDGYVNGMLSVTRVLGDWDMKFPRDVPSPLIAEPEFMQAVLTEDDEFLIIGCDGIWDVMSSQHAVSVVRRGLQLHDDPEKCARELVMEALRLNTFDNLTVIVICFTSECSYSSSEQQSQKLRGCRLSTEALCNLKSWLNDDRRNC